MKSRLPIAAILFLGFVLLPRFIASSQSKVDFVRDIQPIFAAHCTGCHGSKKQESNLRLDEKASALRVITSGQSQHSRLLQRVLGANGEPRMPLNRPALSTAQIQLLQRWIDEGATWSDEAQISNLKSQPTRHWAFVPPVRSTIPTVKNKAWVRNPIDAFILAKLDQENLTPSPEADKITLLRRLSLDLIGLPPTPDEVDAFLKDSSPNAYEKQVERLLASPHYGEKWGRHWLDVARYADSDGFEKDKPRQVWFYRDWVINALNRDLPYDQFIIEQIAGDL
ncbi:MAG TPA: DUF1549 domain-containing protein, partial [Blastocatellia bacterium]|nr:DUF1549 domain-containing protein [Blastocatellia bacterium]